MRRHPTPYYGTAADSYSVGAVELHTGGPDHAFRQADPAFRQAVDALALC
ncbi:hypothetical protein [Kribbella sp. NPDC051620]